jgi:hypothetical protein
VFDEIPHSEKVLKRHQNNDAVCMVIIESGSTDKLVSMEMVEKLELETSTHSTLYKVS